MRRFVALALASGFVIAASTPWAQAKSSECDIVLLQRTVSFVNSQSHFSMAWLNLIDESNYEQMKTDTSGSAYADLFTGNLHNFYDKRGSLYQQQSYSQTNDDARSEVRSELPADAVGKWLECVRLKAAHNNEFELIPRDIDATGVTVEVSWGPAKGVGPLHIDNIQVTGTTAKELQKLKTIGDGSKVFSIARNPDVPIRIEINATAGKPSFPVSGGHLYIPKDWTPPDWVISNRCGCDIHVSGKIVPSSGAGYKDSDRCFAFQGQKAYCRNIGNTEGELDNPLRRDCFVFEPLGCRAIGYLDCFHQGTPFDGLCNKQQFPD